MPQLADGKRMLPPVSEPMAPKHRPDATATPDTLAAHCRAQLARYKVPERIAVTKDLPRNAMSKVVKRRLESLF